MHTEVKVSFSKYDVSIIRAALLEYGKRLDKIESIVMPDDDYYTNPSNKVKNIKDAVNKYVERIDEVLQAPVG